MSIIAGTWCRAMYNEAWARVAPCGSGSNSDGREWVRHGIVREEQRRRQFRGTATYPGT